MKVYNKQSSKPICDEIKNLVENLRKEKNFVAKDYIEQKANLLNAYMNQKLIDGLINKIQSRRGTDGEAAEAQ